MRKPKSRSFRKQSLELELQEIEQLNQWIESQAPDRGTNPIALPALERNARIGRNEDGTFSRYAGATRFDQLPLSMKTKDGLKDGGFKTMTDIQRACLPHALCGRDILGAAKTGSGKTLSFVVPVLEKLYRERWGPEDGVGCIIISPTRELAGQLFDVLKTVGKHHNLSAGLLIGGWQDIDTEKERVTDLNILICTPGRLLQHLDETRNFDCPQLQVLVLDEADRILDVGFKKSLNAIISQLPKHRQTFLFSATQTKSVQDIVRLNMKSPEYLSVHEESVTATPARLQQSAVIVPLEQKLDMLWSFIKSHLNSKILVFLSSCKQVKFVFEAFKKLRPGIPLKCLHGRMKSDKRMGIVSQFCENRTVLFCTDVASRGLDFNRAVDWVVQVDCPENVDSYIHRAGRTARYQSGGKSVLFLMPSEMQMLERLKANKIPIHVTKTNSKRLQPVSGLLAALLVKYPDMQRLAQRAFILYLKSIHKQKDKEIFDVMKLPINEFSASLGLPLTPKIRFLSHKFKGIKSSEKTVLELDVDSGNDHIPKNSDSDNPTKKLGDDSVFGDIKEEEDDEDLLVPKDASKEGKRKAFEVEDALPTTRVLKKKKLKINVLRPVGSRVVFDDEGKTLPPLTRVAETLNGDDSVLFDQDKRNEYYKKMREELKQVDKEDKSLERRRLKEKRMKLKMKHRKDIMGQEEEDEDEQDDELSGHDREPEGDKAPKKSKIYFKDDSDNDEENENNVSFTKDISLAEQEALALRLLSSMH